MRIEYDVTYADMLTFSLIHQFCSPVIQVLHLSISALAFWPEPDGASIPVPSWFLALVFYVGLWVIQFAITAISLISSKNRAILTTHVLEVQSDALVEETKFNKSYFYWHGIVRAISRPGFVAIYIAQHYACVIPNRFFSSQAERASLLSLVNEKLQTASAAGRAQP